MQKKPETKVYFIGAGPGAADLITLRGKRLLEEADLVVYTGSLLNPEILGYTHGRLVNSHGMELNEICDLMIQNAKAGRKVVRLHSGDPSIFGAIAEQIAILKESNIEVEIVPGVSSLFAAAAALQTQLTQKEISETLIVTRPHNNLSWNKSTTLAIFLGAHKIRDLVKNIPPETPVAVVYKASWKDQKIIRGKASNIARKVEEAGINRTALIIIGQILDPPEIAPSHLYSKNYAKDIP